MGCVLRCCCVNNKSRKDRTDSTDGGEDGQYVLDTEFYSQWVRTQKVPENHKMLFKDIEEQTYFVIVLSEFAKGSTCKMNLLKHRPSRLCAALKVYKDQYKAQFMAEVDMAPLTLQCPFLVNVLGGFKFRGKNSILMEFAPFGAISWLVSLRKGLGSEASRFYALEIAKALAFLHDRELLHRDMRLDNMLIRWTGHVVLSDFGLVCSESDEPYTMCGSHVSRPPEVWAGLNQDKGVDIWMFGIAIWNMISNKFPFFHASTSKQRSSVLEAKLNFTPQFNDQSRNLLTRIIVAETGLRPSIEDVIRHDFFTSLDDPNKLPFTPDELWKFQEGQITTDNSHKMAIIRSLLDSTPAPQSSHTLRGFASQDSVLRVGNPRLKGASKGSMSSLRAPSARPSHA